MDNFDLKKYLVENRINEMGTPEQEKIQKAVTQYVNLRKAIDDPNYPDTPHTFANMKKVENILQQMSRKESYRLSLLKMLPTEYQDFLK
jgi:Tfp pilus assembly protein PilF